MVHRRSKTQNMLDADWSYVPTKLHTLLLETKQNIETAFAKILKMLLIDFAF